MTSGAWALPLLASLLALVGVFGLLLVLNDGRLARVEARRRHMADYVRRNYANPERKAIVKNPGAFLEACVELRQSLELGDEGIRSIAARLEALGVLGSHTRSLASRRPSDRIRAAMLLGYFPTQSTFAALLAAFKAERDEVARFYLAAALAIQANPLAVGDLIGSLKVSSLNYRRKAIPLICEFGETLRPYLPRLIEDGDPAIVSLVIHYASLYPSEELRFHLAEIALNSPDHELEATLALAAHYPEDLASDFFLFHSKIEVARVAIDAVSRFPSEKNLERLMAVAGAIRGGGGHAESRRDLASSACSGMAEMTRRDPNLLSRILSEFFASEPSEGRARLAEVLSSRVEYFIAKLISNERDKAKTILAAILGTGKYSDAIAFLNRNRSPELENELLAAFRPVLPEREDFAKACRLYLNPRSLAKLGLESLEFERTARVERREGGKTAALAAMLFILAASVPLALVFGYLYPFSGDISLVDALRSFILGSNRVFAYYSFALNSIGIFLLAFSVLESRRQSKAWKNKRIGFLFKRGMLPSVSIIAPAFCEEKTIIESVNSLLNLRYPDYELIVVNDGSTDMTLDTLISSFELDKVDVSVDERLKTMPIRGLYRNPSIPLLTVVDKSNGGKADSLNAGINVSCKEYFCGIDADSLLEPEALLSAASGSLDTEREYAAAGGNIFPVNGCTVDRGRIDRVGLPENGVARFQTIEYMRAFMGSRVGWSSLDALLIISGAFGLFKKDRVVEVGGYLTSSGPYVKDTVGEDMELVVRLKRSLLERGIRHKIQYCYNANCWTEVPESMRALHGQRDRWHRGLIDILYFHRRMILNPRYGRAGLIAFPYFLIFEIAGPLVETLGWLMVAAAAVLGLLDPPLASLLFLSTLLMGVGVSMCSLLIAHRDRRYFSPKEAAILLGYAVLENFGFRQLVSFWRVGGYLSSMRKPKGWGKMARVGFTKKKPAGIEG